MIAVIGVFVIGACACGGDDDSSSGTTRPTTNGSTVAEPAPGELGPGVSEDTIKIAISLVDFDCIKDFVDEIRVDQEDTYRAFIDDINDNGGINGRMIEPVFKTHCPIPGREPSSLSVCTSATEDDQVFAVLGTFVDFAGDAQLCVTREHGTVLITHGLSQAWIDEAPPGLLLTPDITAERRLDVIMSLLESEGTLDGKTVAVLAEDATKGRIDDAVDPALAAMDVDRASDGILTISGTDTTAAQSQLDSFIEKWKTEHVDALVLLGETTSAKQFVEKIKQQMPDVQLVVDTTSVLGQAQDLQRAGTDPNPYTGIITAEGETGAEHTKGKEAQRCREIYKRQTGKEVPGPNEVVPGPNGKTLDVYGSVGDACVEVTMFADIAAKTGAALNPANWTATVNAMGPMRIASTKYASLSEGKYDADDTYRLVAYDPTIPDAGDWKGLTPVRNVADLP